MNTIFKILFWVVGLIIIALIATCQLSKRDPQRVISQDQAIGIIEGCNGLEFPSDTSSVDLDTLQEDELGASQDGVKIVNKESNGK